MQTRSCLAAVEELLNSVKKTAIKTTNHTLRIYVAVEALERLCWPRFYTLTEQGYPIARAFVHFEAWPLLFRVPTQWRAD